MVIANIPEVEALDGEYDAVSLKQELIYLTPSEYYDNGTMIERCDYTLREYSRRQQNNISVILVVGALFVAVVMAVAYLLYYAAAYLIARRAVVDGG